MSVNPQMIAQILMNHQQQQPQSVGGMQGQSALGGAGQLLQRIAMMRAMQQPPTPQQTQSTPLIQGKPASYNPNVPPQAPNLQNIFQGVPQAVA